MVDSWSRGLDEIQMYPDSNTTARDRSVVKSGVREHCQFSLSLWTQQHKYAGASSLKATIFEVVQEEKQQVEKEWATFFSVIHSLLFVAV